MEKMSLEEAHHHRRPWIKREWVNYKSHDSYIPPFDRCQKGERKRYGRYDMILYGYERYDLIWYVCALLIYKFYSFISLFEQNVFIYDLYA